MPGLYTAHLHALPQNAGSTTRRTPVRERPAVGQFRGGSSESWSGSQGGHCCCRPVGRRSCKSRGSSRPAIETGSTEKHRGQRPRRRSGPAGPDLREGGVVRPRRLQGAVRRGEAGPSGTGRSSSAAFCTRGGAWRLPARRLRRRSSTAGWPRRSTTSTLAETCGSPRGSLPPSKSDHPSAAADVREGLDDMFTVRRLGRFGPPRSAAPTPSNRLSQSYNASAGGSPTGATPRWCDAGSASACSKRNGPFRRIIGLQRHARPHRRRPGRGRPTARAPGPTRPDLSSAA